MSGTGTAQPDGDPVIGATFADRFKVLGRLGQGGMGAVYKAQHLLIESKLVAIKVLHPQFATTGEIVARFLQEAEAASKIRHPHIVDVTDMGRAANGSLFMVLEYLDGRDFADLIAKESPLPIGRVTRICAQICDALQAAHDHNIVHRDLKPENVFLIKRGGDPDFVKVLDFGISKVLGNDEGARAQTRTGAVMGTAYYMAPEQAMGSKSLDHRADIWALGVILYRALTGSYPFDHDAFPMLVVQICHEEPTPPSRLRSDIPPALEQLVLRCLSKVPDKRPPSCAQVLRELAAFHELRSSLPGTRLSSAGNREIERASEGVAARRVGIADPLGATQAAEPTSPAGGRPDVPRTVAPELQPARAVAGGSTSTRAEIPRRSMVPWAVGVTVALAGTIGGAAFSFSSATAPAEPTAPQLVPETGSETANTAPPPEAPPAAHLEFVLSPSEAIALVDDRPVLPDGQGQARLVVLPDDAALHTLRVEAPGFITLIRDLRLSFPQRVVVALRPGTGIEDQRSAAADPAGSTAIAPGTRVRRAPPAEGRVTPAPAGEPGGSQASTTPAAVVSERPPTPIPTTEPTGTASAPEGVVVPPRPGGLRRLPGSH